jgi:hypothetical protein
MSSLFDKLRLTGVPPLKRQKQVVQTATDESDGHHRQRHRDPKTQQQQQQQPRRVQSTVTLAVERPRPAAQKKRRLDLQQSTPNLKRPSPAHRDSSLKPPSPEFLAVPQDRCASRSPRPAKLESSDEESSGDERASKRSKLGSASPQAAVMDNNRRILHPLSFRSKDPKTGEPLQRCKFIHAEEIANTKLPGWSRRKGTIFPPPRPVRCGY